MNYRFLCVLAWVSLAAPLCAQDSKIPPLPTGPLLKRAPDYSTWTVTVQGHPLDPKEPLKTGATGDEPPKEKEPVTMVSTVTKTGSTVLEQNIEADGRRREIWHFSGFRIVSDGSSSTVCPDYGGADIGSVNFASSDFSGLDWVSQTAYSGMAKYRDVDCIVFRGSVSPLSERGQIDEREDIERAKAFGQPHSEKTMVPAVAYIDLESRLPLFVQFGQEKRIYQHGTPPTSPLALPPELAGSVKEYVQKIKRLSAPAVRAY